MTLRNERMEGTSQKMKTKSQKQSNFTTMTTIMEKMDEIQKLSDEIAKEMHISIPKNGRTLGRQTFEDFLQDKHAEEYHGTDDDMPDAYDHWCSELDVEEVCDYAQEWGDKITKI